tara:strand:- start:955 stop:1215 length:261 start_codon:yes stop_codon:yes gene_type:complete
MSQNEDEWVVLVIPVYTARNTVRVEYILKNEAPSKAFEGAWDKYYPADSLPERLKSKVALLSMCEEDSYVEGIGHRRGERVFDVTE